MSKTLTPMKKSELITWLGVNEYGNNYSYNIPNEIFEDIMSQKQLRTPSMKAFVYTYYYLCTYLYGSVVYTRDLTNYRVVDFMKAIGIKSHEHYGFIVKRNGVIDSMGYTISTTDYPVFINQHDNDGNRIKTYTTASQEAFDNNYPKLPKNSFIKYPVKAFIRNEEYYNTYGENCGTFYISDNTHTVSIENFIEIITNQELGHIAFYVFGFMSMMNDRHKDGFIRNQEWIANQIGLSKNSVGRYLRSLEDNGFISTDRVRKHGKMYENIYNVHDKYDTRVLKNYKE